MSDGSVGQYRIGNDGALELERCWDRTWDGEPLWCEETQAELFAARAFQQLAGQLAMDADGESHAGDR